MGKPYALLRAGFPYFTTLGMRRYTTSCIDIAIGDEGRLFVLCRDDGQGGSIRRLNWDDEDLGTIGKAGTGPGQFMWPTTILRNGAERLYVLDEGLHRVSMFDPDGTFVGSWGEHGSAPGQLDRPASMTFDADECIWISDTNNNRVQRFSKDGRYISSFGSAGSADGQFNLPWGIAVDDAGDVYVSDWGNNRVQKFHADGTHMMSFGSKGSGPGELSGPAGIAVDRDGDIYVVDRDNNRVCQFNPEGRYCEQFIGDATLSKSGKAYIMSNPKVLRGREMTSLEPQKRLRGPINVRFDGEGRMYIPDFGSHRIQVYKKEAYALSEDEIWAPPKFPFLFNV
jgi:DNA-binding beta-propeller fold protein YncE